MKALVLLASLMILVSGCTNDTNNPEFPGGTGTGSADFSRFVTIGNSITAGYQSGALFRTAQLNSFGYLINQQVNSVLQINRKFEQPLISDPGTGGRLEFQGLDSKGDPIVVPGKNSGSPENTSYPYPYNNLGVPGATVYDVLNATKSTDCLTAVIASSPNPMFDIVLRNSTLKLGSQFQQAKALSATFITLWIGNNDVLGYATSGGTLPFTPPGLFAGFYQAIADSLSTLGTGVAVANIPDVTSIPYFTTVGPALLKKGYPLHIYAIGSDNKTKLMSIANNFITLRAVELLTDSSGMPTDIGLTSSNPFPNAVVLDSSEVTVALSTVSSYNSSIASLASGKNFALIDINSFFNALKKADAAGGTTVDGVVFKTDYITGGLFSLDGVHPSNRAHGLIANEFIKVINTKYRAGIPGVNISSISPEFLKPAQLDYFGLPFVSKGTYSNLLY